MASEVAEGVEKRIAAERADPLSEAGILERVLSFVPKQWLFLAPVSSLWRSVYTRLAAGEVQSVDAYGTVSTCVTLYSSVFASPSRVRLAHARGLLCWTDSYQLAAGRYGTAASLAAARRLGFRPSIATMLAAVERNQLPVLQFLSAQQGCSYNWSVAEAVAKRGDLTILRWIREHGCAWNNGTILRSAVASGSVEVAAWVKQQVGGVCDEHVMSAAAAMGHTAVCEYLHAEQCPWNEQACDDAARNGHAGTLRWLHEHGCAWYTNSVCTSAAASGCIDVMVCLQQQGIAPTPMMLEHMLNVAGTHDKLAAAQWLSSKVLRGLLY
jgi:hypothetical protein